MSESTESDQPADKSESTSEHDALEKALGEDLDLRQFIEEAKQATPGEDTESIPKLTEVLPLPAKSPTPSDGLNDEQWRKLSLDVERSVLQRMLRRTDGFVEGPLAEQFEEMIDRGTERLMAEIKSTLRQAVRESVSRAIAEELSRIRSDRRQ